MTAFLLTLYLLSRPLEPLFVLRSDPNAPIPADQHPGVDFGDEIRLAGVDDWPAVIELDDEGRADVTAVLYWRALRDLDTNYAVFLHLDGPDGQTWATVDEVNPENIPTRNWPPGLYLRNPLHLVSQGDLPPIRYELTTGVYHRETGQRLPLADGRTVHSLGPIWLTQPRTATIPPPIAEFGSGSSRILLHQAELDGNRLRLMWQIGQSMPPQPRPNHTIFVHVLDDAGNLLTQADGLPFDGLYPIPNWLGGEPFVETRTLDLPANAARVAIGLYDPASGQRLPARNAERQPLLNDSFTVEIQK